MIFKNYIVLDNVLENPEEFLFLSKNIDYFCSKVKKDLPGIKIIKNVDAGWRGYRSDSLDKVNYQLFYYTFNSIFLKILDFPDISFNYNINSYLHFSSSEITFDENWWHRDNSLFAGIIFLNKNPPQNSGTILMENKQPIIIENKFNRLLLYKSHLIHRPECCFGDNVDTARLTLTFFISNLSFFK